MGNNKLSPEYQFFSEKKANGQIHVYVGKDNHPRADYPHVHIIHKIDGSVDVNATNASGKKIFRKTIASYESLSEVERVIKQARDKLEY